MIQPLQLAQRALTTAIPAMSSATDIVPLWVQGCGQLAPLASIVVFLAPIPTMRQISKDRSVGSMPLLPYSSMVSSAFVWVTYGTPRCIFAVLYFRTYLSLYSNINHSDSKPPSIVLS